jgi:hypothetical protein
MIFSTKVILCRKAYRGQGGVLPEITGTQSCIAGNRMIPAQNTGFAVWENIRTLRLLQNSRIEYLILSRIRNRNSGSLGTKRRRVGIRMALSISVPIARDLRSRHWMRSLAKYSGRRCCYCSNERATMRLRERMGGRKSLQFCSCDIEL